MSEDSRPTSQSRKSPNDPSPNDQTEVEHSLHAEDTSSDRSASEEHKEESLSDVIIKPIKRLGIGSSVVIQIILLCFTVIAVNYISCGKNKQFDLTTKNDFSLSERTINYLSKSDIQSGKQNIKIIAVLNEGEFFQYEEGVILRIRKKLDEYKRKSGGKIEIEYVNPLIDASRLEEISSTYNITIARSQIIIDARPPRDQKISEEDLKSIRLNLSPTEQASLSDEVKQKRRIELYHQSAVAKHVRHFPVRSLIITEYNKLYEKAFITNWKDEDIITTGIVSAIEGNPRTIYLLEDKCEFDSDKGGSPLWQQAAQIFALENIYLKRIRVSQISKIPDDADGLALIAPTIDFTESELAVFSEYWNRESSSIFITLTPNKPLPNLTLKLREYGITPRFDTIVTVNNNKQTLTNVQASFTYGSIANGSLEGQTTIFDGLTTSLEVAAGDHTLEGRNITPFSLMKAEKIWWGESKFGTETPTFDQREDHVGDVDIAAAVTRGLFNDEAKKHIASKMVVIGNSDFLATRNIREEQAQYVSQIGNWLVGREELIGISSQSVNHRRITILNAHKSFLDKIFIFFIPAFMLAIMIFVWNIRRS